MTTKYKVLKISENNEQDVTEDFHLVRKNPNLKLVRNIFNSPTENETKNDDVKKDLNEYFNCKRSIYKVLINDENDFYFDNLDKAKKYVEEYFNKIKVLGKKYDLEQNETENFIVYTLYCYCDLYIISYDRVESVVKILKYDLNE